MMNSVYRAHRLCQPMKTPRGPERAPSVLLCCSYCVPSLWLSEHHSHVHQNPCTLEIVELHAPPSLTWPFTQTLPPSRSLRAFCRARASASRLHREFAYPIATNITVCREPVKQSTAQRSCTLTLRGPPPPRPAEPNHPGFYASSRRTAVAPIKRRQRVMYTRASLLATTSLEMSFANTVRCCEDLRA